MANKNTSFYEIVAQALMLRWQFRAELQNEIQWSQCISTRSHKVSPTLSPGLFFQTVRETAQIARLSIDPKSSMAKPSGTANGI